MNYLVFWLNHLVQAVGQFRSKMVIEEKLHAASARSSLGTGGSTQTQQLKLNEGKENRRWTTMDDDAFRFGTLTQRVKGRLRVSRFLSASMVVYLRFDCRIWFAV